VLVNDEMLTRLNHEHLDHEHLDDETKNMRDHSVGKRYKVHFLQSEATKPSPSKSSVFRHLLKVIGELGVSEG
jgi:hypothetical protein